MRRYTTGSENGTNNRTGKNVRGKMERTCHQYLFKKNSKISYNDGDVLADQVRVGATRRGKFMPNSGQVGKLKDECFRKPLNKQ